MIEVGIVGGSGYSGGELLRILVGHPSAKIKWVTSRGEKKLEKVHRNLIGFGLEFCKPEEAGDCDVVFLCTPATVSMKYAKDYLERGIKVIDMAADFRLKSPELYKKVYKTEHAAPELLKEAVYGTTELKRGKIAKARIVANPGCYSNTVILGLAPLVKSGLVELDSIVVNALSGTSGAGAECSVFTHHSEIATGAFPYNVVKHRHTYEMEQELSEVAGKEVRIHFSCYYTPFVRGILAGCNAFLKKSATREKILEVYKEFYKGEYFIRILDFEKEGASTEYIPYPTTGSVAGSNFCQIGVDVDDERGRVVVFSATDNLMKGASGQGVQNMNVMMGIDEKTALAFPGLHP
ncbi:MAG: N-acetyl-gamma-glutamyl-phosphate reductase [Candidatus Micrarchaeia archaeon]